MVREAAGTPGSPSADPVEARAMMPARRRVARTSEGPPAACQTSANLAVAPTASLTAGAQARPRAAPRRLQPDIIDLVPERPVVLARDIGAGQAEVAQQAIV